MEKIKRHSNTALKIMSFIMAIVLWAYVAYKDNPEVSHWVRNVPITVIGSEALSDAGFYVTGTSRTSVDVKLKGDRTTISRIRLSDISAVVDVSQIKREGDTALICDVSVNSGNIEVASRDITVTVSSEAIITDTYPISIRMVGSPADGYSVFDTGLSYNEVSVRGTKSVISTIASVSTKSVSVNDATLGGTVSVGLTAYDAEGNSISGVTFEPSTVDVIYTVLREKTVPLKISLTKVPADKEISYSPGTIKIYGFADALAPVDSIISVPLDVSGAKDGDVYNARLYVPNGVRLLNEDSTVDITVSVEEPGSDE